LSSYIPSSTSPRFSSVGKAEEIASAQLIIVVGIYLIQKGVCGAHVVESVGGRGAIIPEYMDQSHCWVLMCGVFGFSMSDIVCVCAINTTKGRRLVEREDLGMMSFCYLDILSVTCM
jgi:hypothetical protein